MVRERISPVLPFVIRTSLVQGPVRPPKNSQLQQTPIFSMETPTESAQANSLAPVVSPVPQCPVQVMPAAFQSSSGAEPSLSASDYQLSPATIAGTVRTAPAVGSPNHNGFNHTPRLHHDHPVSAQPPSLALSERRATAPSAFPFPNNGHSTSLPVHPTNVSPLPPLRPVNGVHNTTSEPAHQSLGGTNGMLQTEWSSSAHVNGVNQQGGMHHLQQHQVPHSHATPQPAAFYATATASAPSQAVGHLLPISSTPSIGVVQNPHHTFPMPHLTISQPSACIAFQPPTIAPIATAPAPLTHMSTGCNGFQQPYLHASGLSQPVTLTITQPQVIPNSQVSQSTLERGPQSPSSNVHHANNSTCAALSTADSSAGSDASGHATGQPGGGFTFGDMTALWNNPGYEGNNGSQPSATNGFSHDVTQAGSNSSGEAASPGPNGGAFFQALPGRYCRTNPPNRDFQDQDKGQLTITVKAGREAEDQLSRMCTMHPRQRDIRIRRLERLPSHRRHFRCETCTDILVNFVKNHGLYPDDTQKQALLKKVGMTPTAVSYWFSNRRRANIGNGGGSPAAGQPRNSRGK